MLFKSNFLLLSDNLIGLNTTLSQYFFAPFICIFAVSQPKCTNWILLYMSIFLQWVDNLHENVIHPSGKCGQHLANNQSVTNFPGDFNQQVAYSVIGHSGAVISQNDHRQSGLAACPNQ